MKYTVLRSSERLRLYRFAPDFDNSKFDTH